MSSGGSASDDATRQVGETVLSLDAARSGLAPIVPRSGLLDRYAVIEEIGRGGMGVVLRAYDPKLQREVALKVVRAESTNTEARLNREARAMAQLNHPNVVAIYDVSVGEAPDGRTTQVVLAMEYVAGVTLRQWRRAEERSVAEVLDALVQAGRGLAAAHREGLLHRDFKPDNVLVGDDARVRVTDFGLARVDGERETRSAAASAGDWSAASDNDLTRVGTILGTPKYMAPEQHRAQALGPAADQFAFCVTLWEALHDEPPFRGRTVEALLEEKLAGPPTWPRGVAVSSRIVEALRRGLSPDPEQRFGTMDELLLVLAPQGSKPWRTRALVLGTGVAAIAVTWTWLVASSTNEVCTGADEQLAGVWDAPRRAEVESAFVDGPIAYAPSVWERIAPQLDTWAQDWASMHGEACEATRVRGEQSEAVMDPRIDCLRRARLQLAAAVDVLADAAPTAVENAHEIVDGLPAVSRCADVEALQADVPLPESDEADAVAAIRRDLADAGARRIAGEYDAALAAAQRAESGTQSIAYEPVRTEVHVELGAIHNAMGRYDEAEAALRQAQQLGSRWHQWDAVRTATVRLIFVLGYEMARHGEALALRELALGLSSGAPAEEALARNNVALVLDRLGKYAEAEAEHLAALELRRSALGPDHPDVAGSRNNLANVLIEQGRYDEAETEYRAALAVRSKALGSEHPDVAATRNNIGLVLQEQGRWGEAEVEHRAALALRIKALGPDHPDTAASHNNLGLVLQLQGKFAEAELEDRRALELWVAAFGPDHPHVARSRMNLASALSASGRFAEGEVEYRKALAVLLEAMGPDHPNVAAVRHNLAIALKGQGKLDEAEAEFRTAMKLRIAALGPEHPDVASSRNNLGNVLHDQGKEEESEVEHRAALAAWTAALGPEHPDVAASHNNLAAVLFANGKDAEAEAEYRASLEVRAKVLEPDHPDIADSLVGLGNVLLHRGARVEALPLLERALTIETTTDTTPGSRGRAELALARALWADPASRDRARALAKAAERDFVESGPADADDLEETVTWRRTHP